MSAGSLIGVGAAVLASPVPDVSEAEAEAIFRRLYGRDGVAELLAGERDRNFRLRERDGGAFMLKITNPVEERSVTEFQTDALCHVARSDPAFPVPRVVPTVTGELIAWEVGAEDAGDDRRPRAVRLFTWVAGELLGSRELAPMGLRDLGGTLARLAQALAGFSHPAERHPLLWDMQQAVALRPLLTMIPDDTPRAWVARLIDRFEARVLPVLPGLPGGVIHNDVTGSNLLMRADDDQRVTGVLDFGDLVRAPLAQELGVTASYHLHRDDGADLFAPLAALLAGYEAVRPMTEAEALVLFDLIATRLALRGLIPAWRAALYPENRDYLMRNAGRAWQVMGRVAEMDPDRGQARLLALWNRARDEVRA
jgi:hydroxylysine kinase